MMDDETREGVQAILDAPVWRQSPLMLPKALFQQIQAEGLDLANARAVEPLPVR